MANMFIQEKLAKKELLDYLKSSIVVKIIENENFHPVKYEFFRKLLKAIYREKTWNLRNKANIYIQEGAMLYGVADPDENLNEN